MTDVEAPPLRMSPAADAQGDIAYQTLRALARRAARQEAPTAALIQGLPRFEAALDRFFEAVLQANRDRPVTCHAGCSHCCHQWVHDVAPFEIDRLGRWIDDRGLRAPLRPALERRHAAYRTLEAEVYAEAAIEDPEAEIAVRYLALRFPCVFLTPDGRCGVYAIRPYVCRTFFSLSSPEFCTAEGLRSGQNRSFFLEPHEAMDGALRPLVRHYGSEPNKSLVEGLAVWLDRTA